MLLSYSYQVKIHQKPPQINCYRVSGSNLIELDAPEAYPSLKFMHKFIEIRIKMFLVWLVTSNY